MTIGGRGGATHARNVENMNNAQLNAEIRKAKGKITAAQSARESASAMTARERALQEAFPLGAGGFSRTEANRMTGKMAESALSRGVKLETAIKQEQTAKKRLDVLTAEKNRRKSTSSTASVQTSSTMKWKTTQKQSMSGGSLKPRVISSGAYEIRGTSVLRVYHNGVLIGSTSSLQAAKAIAEKHKSRR